MEQEDEERKDIVQQILQKSTDFPRRIVPVEGQVKGHSVVPSVSSVSVGRLHLVGLVRARRLQEEAVQLVVCGMGPRSKGLLERMLHHMECSWRSWEVTVRWRCWLRASKNEAG